MPTASTDPTFLLIKTLTKAEKRNFRLYVTRNQSKDDLKFILLFDAFDKQTTYDEDAIFKKVPEIKKEQLSNLKAHLYRQLLTSLRLLHKQKNADIDIREHIDYAKILYNKGLYVPALRILEKAKGMARLHNQSFLILEIVEFEKLIESRHITRAHEGRATELAQESQQMRQQLLQSSQLTDLALQMYGFYLQFGHARNAEDLATIEAFFKSNYPPLYSQPVKEMMNGNEIDFFGKVYLAQSLAWKNYVSQDWLQYCRWSYQWVLFFEREPIMKLNDTSLYIKGIHNLLLGYFLTLRHDRMLHLLQSLENYLQKHADTLDENTQTLAFHHLYSSKINVHFLQGTFAEGVKLIPEIERQLKSFQFRLDQHRVLVLYYKIASLYFGNGNYGKTIDYLNKIINAKLGNLRADIQCFARLLQLIVHFEKGHYNLLEYLIKSAYRFIAKNEDLSGVMTEVLKFLRRAMTLGRRDLRQAFIELRERLIELSVHPFERRSFIYLDIISWLDSKIDNKPIAQIIHEKFLEREKARIRP